MKLSFIGKQYDNESLVFNKQSKRYELTLQYVKDNFEITFKDDGILENRIKKNSRKVYDYILTVGNTHNREIIMRLLNETENGRLFLLDCLTTQMDADLTSGFNDITKQSPINMNNGQIIDRNALRQNRVSVETEDIVDRNIGYFGINLVYNQPFDRLLLHNILAGLNNAIL